MSDTYGNIEPQTDWGSCPACDAVSLEWYEEGPICPTCGHLWDHDGGDIGSWEENMGTPWEASSAKDAFERKEAQRREWWATFRRRPSESGPSRRATPTGLDHTPCTTEEGVA